MNLHTKKQEAYFEEVIRLHYEKGYEACHISRILPVSRNTVYRWIAIFASENAGEAVKMRKTKPQTQPIAGNSDISEIEALQREIARLQSQLKEEKLREREIIRLQSRVKEETLRADAYDEMISVAESKFKIPIRKKAGVKR